MDDRFRNLCVIILGIMALTSIVAATVIAALGRDIPTSLAAAIGLTSGVIAGLIPPPPRDRGMR